MLNTKNIDGLVEEYRKCAEICLGTDYGDELAVKKHNKAVDNMYSIVENIASQGSTAIDRLSVLLDEENLNTWIAFQLLDRIKVTPEIEKKCLSIIQNQASGEGPNALGTKYWLKEWKRKKRKDKFRFLQSLFRRCFTRSR